MAMATAEPAVPISGPDGNAVVLRMDDVGAASKKNEVHGSIRLGRRRFRKIANVLFLKYIPPIKQWGPYRELAAPEWEAILELLEMRAAKLTVAITAGWVEDDGSVTPFPEKFSDQARIIRRGVDAGRLEVANHGYTHCIVEGGRYRPQLFRGNQPAHREFTDDLPGEKHREHLRFAQDILQGFFGVRVETFVPPGTGFKRETLAAAVEFGIRYVSVSKLAPKRDWTDDRLVFVESLPANKPSIVTSHSGDLVWHFHDRDLVYGGVGHLEEQIERHHGRRFLTIREAGQRQAAMAQA